MIEMQHVSKTYGKSEPAVDDLSITVRDGEIVGFIGPNGAGKTTTIRMMTGILRPDAGEIKINGIHMAPDALEAKRIVGYISDNPDMFLKLTGYEFVGFMADIYGVSEEDRKSRTQYYAEQFGMTEALADRMQSYSHGMRQKAMIIAALVHEPPVWILDEPLTGLDPLVASELYSILQHIHDAHGIAVIMVTHDVECAVRHAKTILHIGKTDSFFGSCAEYEASPLGQRFLGEEAAPEHCENCLPHAEKGGAAHE